MKNQKKGFLSGFALALVLAVTLGTALAATGQVNAVLNYRNIKICIDGQLITPVDSAGNPTEPFIIDGTTYLPVRAVASALGKEVSWDDATSTVYLGARPSTGSGATGTRSDPLKAGTGAQVTYNNYSFYPTRQVNVKVLKTITGDGANYIAAQAASETMNRLPAAGEEYVFFEVECKYISSSDGEDDQLDLGSVVNGDQFFGADGSALAVSDHTYIMSYGKFASYEPKSVYPGGSSKFLVGALVNKGYDKVLLKVPNNSDRDHETNTWVWLNDGDSTVISTVDGVKSAYGIDQGGNSHENDAIKITLKNSLPESLSYYERASATSADARATITDFTYTSSTSSAKITFTGEKTYDAQGSGYSRPVYVGWKLYDAEGYVVDDGTARSTSIKVGEKFKNCEDTIYNLEPGEYTLEIMGVRG